MNFFHILLNRFTPFFLLLTSCLLFLSLPSLAIQSSSSLITSPNKKTLYSANFDAGSVSKISLTENYPKKYVQLGKDIRRLALGDEGQLLAATDYLANEVILLDAESLNIKHRTSTPSRPFSVVYDSQQQLFWVSLFETAKLIAINHQGDIVNTTETSDTPRGLAITDDQRLLLTHSMTGELSIYDIKTITPKLITKIKLQESQYEDQFRSQGLPRLLDDIAISPDGTEAWLPHVLWNFDHPFQFQSTVFPAISVVNIQHGQEGEKVELRKELFKQINVLDNNRTRIISNPADAEFSVDGSRLFVTMAGSEDLVVVDLSRRAKNRDSTSKKKKRSKRRQGKINQGGSKVTQILRHIPGDNPRGLQTINNQLYVHNAMSQDVVLLNAGKSGPFARVKNSKNISFKTLKKDPVSAGLRLGKRLFNSANGDDFPSAPMAGDFWMSCNSCHLDGFNFTNRYLLKDGLANKDKYQDMLSGHRDVIKMIAGDSSSALAQIIKNTQGGLGHDTQMPEDIKPPKDVTQPIAPQKLSQQVEVMMRALKSYITQPENLPYLSTWLKLDSENGTSHKSQWLNSASCSGCHETIYQQWANSNHGSMMDHPYYRFQENFAAQQEGEKFRNLCRGCHFPQALLTGEKMPQTSMANMHEKGGRSLITALEKNQSVVEAGTGCLFCHRVVKVENAGGNADLTINLDKRKSYVFEGANFGADLGANLGVLNWLSDRMINANPDAHKASYSNPDLYQDSVYCASCHNEFTPGPGAPINDNYGEWLASSFNVPNNPQKNRSCIDCHMHADPQRIGQDIPGYSTDGGQLKNNVRTHQFTGANNYLAGLRSDTHAKLSESLLKTAATLDVMLNKETLTIRVNNKRSGHHLPGGSRRQLWLEVKVTDGQGKLVYSNGELDDKQHVPSDARKFHKVGADKHGTKVGLSFWRVEKLLEDTRIPADSSRDEIFELPINLQYPVNVSARLLFKAFSKKLTDKVRGAFPNENIPYAPVVEMQAVNAVFNRAELTK